MGNRGMGAVCLRNKIQGIYGIGLEGMQAGKNPSGVNIYYFQGRGSPYTTFCYFSIFPLHETLMLPVPGRFSISRSPTRMVFAQRAGIIGSKFKSRRLLACYPERKIGRRGLKRLCLRGISYAVMELVRSKRFERVAFGLPFSA